MCLDTLKDSGSTHTTYNICDFNLAESLVDGQKYTISAMVNTSEEKKSVAFYLSGGSMGLGSWQAVTESGIYKVTFTATSAHASNTAGTGHGYIRVYASNNVGGQGSTAITGTANVEWLKVEVGETATQWCPNNASENYYWQDIRLVDESGNYLTQENGFYLTYNITSDAWNGFYEGNDKMSIYQDYIKLNELIEW